MKTLTLNDLRIAWSRTESDDAFVLTGNAVLTGDPEDQKPRLTFSVHVPKDVITDDEEGWATAKVIAEERVTLDLEEISGTGAFGRNPGDKALNDMREAVGLKRWDT